MIEIFDVKNYHKYSGEIYIHKNAEIAENIKIGFGSIIHDNVLINEGCVIHEHCIIRPGVKLGKNSLIHDNVELGYKNKDGIITKIGNNSVIRRLSTIYAGSSFGENFQSGVGVVIREECEFGDNCSVGTYTQFEGYTQVGNYSRFHTNAHIGQHSKIGNYVWIFPYVVFTNDKYPPHDICPPYKNHKGPIIKDFAIISTHSMLMPNIVIGKDSIIAAKSNVTKNVPAGELWIGNPAKFMKKIEDISFDEEISKIIGFKYPYPWRKSFKRENYHIIDKL